VAEIMQAHIVGEPSLGTNASPYLRYARARFSW